MTRKCNMEGPCPKESCFCGFYDSEVAKELSVAPLTSGEAFGKAVDVIDSATEEFAKFARQGAAAYFAKLEEGSYLFESMNQGHLKQVLTYMERAAETMAINMQKAFADAAK